ncbi:hypothetical protein [Chitinimonas sp. BJB300]|uniref:hypothetical protein n=1 Tax=Chitinimonas sp. BJB300 TaxID=1559339 RepID=UPI000C118CD8|nr:hypothetical protein [Chitinimonas sp. BJB300]PHV09810.1 hypothetical protein CSQ89_19625 [Chitinimonas sp. BJB300]TSJ84579.1 hypothetical protein FG002_019805 [Chitinimonas sp. BJB300]
MEDGRTASAAATLEARELIFDEVVLKAAVGNIRPDVTALQKSDQLFIEIAVNHFVDEEKRAKLLALDIPTVEIALDLIRHEEWDWDKLSELVIQSLENKQWLVFPDLAELRAEAKSKAIALAQALPPPHVANKCTKQRVMLGGATVYVYLWDDAITVRKYGLMHYDYFKEFARLMRRMGGLWGDHNDTWRLPRNVAEPLMHGLHKLQGAASENRI